MRTVLITCLLLAGCTTNPAELRGKPLDEAISEFGDPAGAVDYQGSRAFFFKVDGTGNEVIKANKDLLNKDMPITKTNFNPTGCFYIINALWTNATENWKIHSVEKSAACPAQGGNN